VSRPDGTLGMLDALLRRTHLSAPVDLARIVEEEAGRIGAQQARVLLVDPDLTALTAVPVDPHGVPGPPLDLEGTPEGQAFCTVEAVVDGDLVAMPLLDGTERIGVLAARIEPERATEELLATFERLAHLVALLVITKGQYSDVFEVVRRRESMTLAAELVWELVPPLVFATDGLVLAAMLEPCYDNGGDAFDYAVGAGVARFAIFDAMGHGVQAAGAAAFAISAGRRARRRGLGLAETMAELDATVAEHVGDERFVTALLVDLELATGRLRWASAGHPAPLVLRGGRDAEVLETRPASPLGVRGRPPTLHEGRLHEGDLLALVTDGVTEARDSAGAQLGNAGIAAFLAEEGSAGRTAPEVLRRLRRQVIDRGALRDDATALLVQWGGGAEVAFVPDSVLPGGGDATGVRGA
jgi:serine phosphatase RsbU (regulator of sigma subunit)